MTDYTDHVVKNVLAYTSNIFDNSIIEEENKTKINPDTVLEMCTKILLITQKPTRLTILEKAFEAHKDKRNEIIKFMVSYQSFIHP